MAAFNSSLTNRALDIAQSLGDGLKTLSPKATTLLDAGAKLGALRAGTKVASVFLRRNPAVLAATVVGGGLLWYAARRKQQREQASGATVDGTARRVDARSGDASQTRRRSGTTRTRARKATNT